MKRVIIPLAVFIVAGCTNSPAHRIAECEKTGKPSADCVAAEWNFEHNHPLPKYDTSEFDRTAALQTALDQSNARASKQK